MGRPSVADARRRQVLEAAIRVLATNGLAATTLDGIAAEAGMARGHVRHFAGNRDEILTTAAQLLYFGELPDPDATTHAGSFLPAGTTDVSGALDYLFGAFAEPGPENVAALAFVDAARTNDRIRAVVVDAYRSSEAELRALLSGVAPRGDDAGHQRRHCDECIVDPDFGGGYVADQTGCRDCKCLGHDFSSAGSIAPAYW